MGSLIHAPKLIKKLGMMKYWSQWSLFQSNTSHEKYFKFEWLRKYESIGGAQWLFWCYENIYKCFETNVVNVEAKKRGIKLVGTHPCSLLFSDKPGWFCLERCKWVNVDGECNK